MWFLSFSQRALEHFSVVRQEIYNRLYLRYRKLRDIAQEQI